MADLIDRDALLLKQKAHADLFADSTVHDDIVRRDEATSALAEIINAPSVTRWIPVEDALPEIKEYHISETVLCYCDSGALAIARLEENGFGQVGFNCEEDDGYGYYSVGKVLYWMPIPEIPEPPEKE